MKLKITLLAAALGLFASAAVIAEPQPTDIRIMDPAELIEMGFDPVTDEVWRAPEIADRPMLDARLANAELGPAAAPNPEVDPIWTSVQGTDFHFRGQTTSFFHDAQYSLSCEVGSPVRHADASIQFPNGHRVTWMDVWAVDSSTTAGVEAALYEVCERNLDPPSRTVVQLAKVDTTAATASGAAFLNKHAGANRWVKSAQCAYMVRATFSSCVGNAVLLQKVRVLWDYD